MLDGTRVGHPVLEGSVFLVCTVFSLLAFLSRTVAVVGLTEPPLELHAMASKAPDPMPSAEPDTAGSLWAVRKGFVAANCGVFLVSGEADGFVLNPVPGGDLALVIPGIDPGARQSLCETLARTEALDTDTQVGVVDVDGVAMRVTAYPAGNGKVNVQLERETDPEAVIGLSREQQTMAQLLQIVDTVDSMTRDLTALEGVARGRERGDDTSTHAGAPAAAE
jgi:hypothetical protein